MREWCYLQETIILGCTGVQVDEESRTSIRMEGKADQEKWMLRLFGDESAAKEDACNGLHTTYYRSAYVH